MSTLEIVRLAAGDEGIGRAAFAMMAGVLGEGSDGLPTEHVAALLRHKDFLAFVALEGGVPVGGLTAFLLPMTRSATIELLIYDLAVLPTHQRRGIGHRLVETARHAAAEAGAKISWVAADDEDSHALDFYRAIGGSPTPVTIFTFEPER